MGRRGVLLPGEEGARDEFRISGNQEV